MLEVWGVWRAHKKREKKHAEGRNDFVGWSVCREKQLRLISERRGRTWNCFRGWEVCFFWHEKQQFDKRGAPQGKRCLQMQRLTVTQCESKAAKTRLGGFACLKHWRLQSNQDWHRPQLHFLSPEDEFCSEGSVADLLAPTLGSSPRSDCLCVLPFVIFFSFSWFAWLLLFAVYLINFSSGRILELK